jgi:protease PrsW
LRTHLDRDRLLMGSPLRRPGTCKLICAVLVVVLAFATIIHLSVFATMRPDMLSVFERALARSTALSVIPLAVLWFLDRRERESPLLFAAAFLWGGCIATGLAVPFNTAFFQLADLWVREHPLISQILGPDAAVILAAPISAPIIEEIAKALGVLLIFWLLRAEFDNMRDGIVYGALVGLGFNWFEAALYVAASAVDRASARSKTLNMSGRILANTLRWTIVAKASTTTSTAHISLHAPGRRNGEPISRRSRSRCVRKTHRPRS